MPSGPEERRHVSAGRECCSATSQALPNTAHVVLACSPVNPPPLPGVSRPRHALLALIAKSLAEHFVCCPYVTDLRLFFQVCRLGSRRSWPPALTPPEVPTASSGVSPSPASARCRSDALGKEKPPIPAGETHLKTNKYYKDYFGI